MEGLAAMCSNGAVVAKPVGLPWRVPVLAAGTRCANFRANDRNQCHNGTLRDDLLPARLGHGTASEFACQNQIGAKAQ